MRAYLDCYPCFLRQTLEAARMATEDEDIHRRVLQRVSAFLGQLPPEATPIDAGLQIHRTVKEMAATPDPYREVKRECNDRALSLYPDLRELVEDAPDPLLMAVKLAAVGNTVDFGANPEFDLTRSLNEGVEQEFAGSGFRLFSDRLREVHRVLYIGDNTGEIVFDKILVEELVTMGLDVTFVVREEPIINDATLEDALYVGMDEVAEIVTSGVGSPGTLLHQCHPAFRDTFRRAEMILAKGQGNYEGLSGEEGPVFFLLKVKCPVIARDLGATVGDLVLRASDPG